MSQATEIRCLQLGYTKNPIEVWHLHTWQELFTGNHEVHHLLLDKKGTLVVAQADPTTPQSELPVLQDGQIYRIASFYVGPARTINRCCSNNVELGFTRNTTLQALPEPPPDEYHPTNMSEAVPFGELWARCFDNRQKSDMLGRIVSVSKPYAKGSTEMVPTRQLVILEDGWYMVNKPKGPVIATFTSMIGKWSKGKPLYKSTCSTRLIVDQKLRMHRPMFFRHSNSNMPIFYIDSKRTVEPLRPIQSHSRCDSIAELLFQLATEWDLSLEPSPTATSRCFATIQAINHGFGYFRWLCPECLPQQEELLSNDVCSNCYANIFHDDRVKSFYISVDVADETDHTTFLISHEAASALLQTSPRWDLEAREVERLLQSVLQRTYTFEVKNLPRRKHNRECFEVVAVWHRDAANMQE
ncbi:unnamed protein product [Linum trigynum]|uniref:Uncharacterized protein n=1 Tax=Linum trigynum TaxID=586398 RepID=A0AAV2F4J0_9ROSI